MANRRPSLAEPVHECADDYLSCRSHYGPQLAQWSQFMDRGLEPMGRAEQAFSFRPTLRAHGPTL
jgi:hypothetical protein